jgi:hypothetical protein
MAVFHSHFVTDNAALKPEIQVTADGTGVQITCALCSMKKLLRIPSCNGHPDLTNLRNHVATQHVDKPAGQSTKKRVLEGPLDAHLLPPKRSNTSSDSTPLVSVCTFSMC